MTPEETNYAEIIKQKVAEQLAHFLLLKNEKPERVQLVVDYPESRAKLEININD